MKWIWPEYVWKVKHFSWNDGFPCNTLGAVWLRVWLYNPSPHKPAPRTEAPAKTGSRTNLSSKPSTSYSDSWGNWKMVWRMISLFFKYEYGFKYRSFQQFQHTSNSATLPLAKSFKAHGHRPTSPAVVVSRWCHGVLHLQVSEDALLGKDSKEVFLKSADQTT